MPVEFKLPDLGEGIHEGEIIEVLVYVGDRVEDGQPVLIVEQKSHRRGPLAGYRNR